MHKNRLKRFVFGSGIMLLSVVLLAGCSQLNERPLRLYVEVPGAECAGGISAQLEVEGSKITLESPIIDSSYADDLWTGTTIETVARHTPMTVVAQCYAESGEVIGFNKSRGSKDFSQAWQTEMVISVYTTARNTDDTPCNDDGSVLEKRGVDICIDSFDGRTPSQPRQAGASLRKGSR